jgi:hypothetical protein
LAITVILRAAGAAVQMFFDFEVTHRIELLIQVSIE